MKKFLYCFLFFIFSSLPIHQVVLSSEQELLARTAVTSISNMKDFKGSTYTWHKATTQYYDSPKIGDPALQGMLMKAIANTLFEKGYEFRKNSWESDMYIGYVAALESSLNSEDISKIYGINPGLPEMSSDLNKYEKGTLIIHVFDTRFEQLLWRGALQAEVKLENDPDARWKRVQNAINVLLRDFPIAESD